MKAVLFAIVLGLVIAVASFAQPSVSALQNNYSYILPGLPNYGIAQGSIFVMYGKNMGPTQLAQASSFPLSKTLAGVTINVTGSDGKTYQAIPYYVSAGQIAAILPSATPVGNATIAVTYNGQTSAAAQVKVVKTDFGILTLNNAGSGAAAAFDTHSNFLGPTNAANPGDIVTLWGTGLGPAPGDETAVGGTAVDLDGNVPITVWVGSQQATVQYHGRSQYPGLDQINIYVPSGLSGCYVSVVVQGGTMVSNFATIPVVTSGRVCADFVGPGGLSASDIQALIAKGSGTLGFAYLSKVTNQTPAISIGGITVPGSTTTTDGATAFFAQYTAQYFIDSGLGNEVSMGGCILWTVQNVATMAYLPVKYLDAGTITLAMPSGSSVPLTKASDPQYGTLYSMTSSGQPGQSGYVPSFIPSSGGKFTFDNGSGGTAVGHFNTSLTIGSPTLVWTNIGSVGPTISSSTPPTLTWTGGDPNGYILISGASMQLTSANSATETLFSCMAQQSALQFTIPQWVLLAMPATTSTAGVPMGSLTINSWGQPQRFTVPGIDYASQNWYVGSSKPVGYTP